MTNQITIIKPYRYEGQWVFDDASVDLLREPFIAGADTLIDVAIAEKDIKKADKGFLLLFSASRFPGADHELVWQRKEMDGDVYRLGELEGWLCPALLKYFNTPPARIWVQVKDASGT